VREQLESLVAHIAQKYGIGRENLATEILVQILRSGGDAVVRALFKHYGLDLPLSSDYELYPQRRGDQSRCIPDIQIRNRVGETLAILESKFDAALTRHQPNGYLAELGAGGLLVFVVPERHQRARFEQVIEPCRKPAVELHSIVIDSGRTRASVDGKNLTVTSWREVLDRLQQSIGQLRSDLCQQRLLSDLDQLRRFCDVADKETFTPLTADQISGGGVPALIRHMTWLTQKLISKCIEADILQEIMLPKRSPKYEMRADFDSSLSFGQSLSISGEPIWIGFWALAWEMNIGSPLCIQLDPKRLEARKIVGRLHEESGEGFVSKVHLFDHEEWLIPIPLEPLVTQDEAVEAAFRFVAKLKVAIDKATSY
jgi:hypothetical protein